MASTVITTNTDALSRAADAILARDGKLTKNAILNALSAAIAGPGHDWGFLKNAPKPFVQAGLSDRAERSEGHRSGAANHAWAVQYDERYAWGREPALFATKQEALRFVADDHAWWQHSDHDFKTVMTQLEQTGEYVFSAHDGDDEIDAYKISIHHAVIREPQDPQIHSQTSPQSEQADAPTAFVVFDLPMAAREQGLDYGTALFADQNELFAFALSSDLDKAMPEWRTCAHPATECLITAHIRPEAWFRDNAIEVDPQGAVDWDIDADELDPTQPDLDYLKSSRKAPNWVREWTGPFTITMTIQHGDLVG